MNFWVEYYWHYQ